MIEEAWVQMGEGDILHHFGAYSERLQVQVEIVEEQNIVC